MLRNLGLLELSLNAWSMQRLTAVHEHITSVQQGVFHDVHAPLVVWV